MLVLHDRDDAGIACKTPRGFNCYRWTVLNFTAAGAASLQGLPVDMDDDLMLVTAAHRGCTVLEEALSEQF